MEMGVEMHDDSWCFSSEFLWMGRPTLLERQMWHFMSALSRARALTPGIASTQGSSLQNRSAQPQGSLPRTCSLGKHGARWFDSGNLSDRYGDPS